MRPSQRLFQLTYQYKSLRKGHIRLVCIRPGRWTDPISCDILHTPLDGRESRYYEALSYAWGVTRSRWAINCGNSGILVSATINCIQAIRRLRYQNCKRSAFDWHFPYNKRNTHYSILRPNLNYYRLVWIDALCINQTDSNERNEQVRLMGTIFRNAARVIIYMGESSEDSDKALNAIADIGGRATSCEVAAIKSLLQRPWFERVWVLQEVAMSRAASAVCGSASIPWECFTAPHLWRTEINTNKSRSPAVLSYGSDFSFVNGSLLQQLHDTRGNLASDPRDKVIALVGMTPSSEDWSKLVDYSCTVEETYTNVVKLIIQRTSSVRVLCGVESRSADLPNLPSWVPDWSTPALTHSFGLGSRGKGCYNAGGHPAIISWGSPQDSHMLNLVSLKARGVRVDSIKVRGDCCDLQPSQGHLQTVLARWRRHVNMPTSTQAGMS